MNKSDLIKEVADKTNITQLQAKEVVNATLQIIKNETLESGKVSLAEFGVFKRHDSPARKGRNPLSGASVDIPAKTSIKFKSS